MTKQITTATNVQGPNLSGTQNNADKFFNNFFAGDFSIGSVNDAVVAYFEKYTGNKTSGQALAATVIYTAQQQNLNPMELLGQFQKLTPNELNTYLAAFLNFNRVPTSQLGIKTSTNTSPYITRTILP
jgi:hypothetical protein